MFFKSLFKVANKLSVLGLVLSSGFVLADDLKPFQPFDLSNNKSLTQVNARFSHSDDFFQNSLSSSFSNYDFLAPQAKGYHLSKNVQGMFGDELVVGMKFADWLTLRLNVIDDSDSFDIFTNVNRLQAGQSGSDFAGYQWGVSSVMSITENWRLGFDLGRGQIGGELLGLYQDHIQTTSLGFGVRNHKFGATFQSDYLSSATYHDLEQSTLDLQVDWHFTQDGTISFGARHSVNEGSVNTDAGQLTGTVPYIKFKHSL